MLCRSNWKYFSNGEVSLALLFPIYTQDFSGGASGKEPPANAGDKKDTGSIPGLKR